MLRRARAEAPDQLDQIDDGTSRQCRRSRRADHLSPDDAERRRHADDQLRGARSGMRPRLRAQQGEVTGGRSRALEFIRLWRHQRYGCRGTGRGMKRRVVITGIGLVSPFGSDLTEFGRALHLGTSAVKAIENADGFRRANIPGAPVNGFSPRDHVDPKSLRLMSPAVAFGVAAAQLAAADSRLAFDALDPIRLGAFVGSRGHSSDRQDLVPAVDRAPDNGASSLSSFGAHGAP